MFVQESPRIERYEAPHLTLQEAMIAATAIFLVFNFLAQITPKTAYTFF